jgi:hypothetical protein
MYEYEIMLNKIHIHFPHVVFSYDSNVKNLNDVDISTD